MTKKMPQLAAANDNAPRASDSFADLAERRAWLSSVPQKTKAVMAWPTIERLRDMRTVAATAALFAYRDLMEPTRIVAANDNSSEAGIMGADRVQVTRPSDKELLEASNEIATSERRCPKLDGDGPVENIPAYIEYDEVGNQQIGRFRFNATGRMIGFTGRTGRSVTPHVRLRGARGQKAAGRSSESIRFLLQSDAPIAKGAYFFGGITRPRGNTSAADVGERAADRELRRKSTAATVRGLLGVHYAAILDMALTDATARQIGETLGYRGDYAERKAVALIDEAIGAFARLQTDGVQEKIDTQEKKLAG